MLGAKRKGASSAKRPPTRTAQQRLVDEQLDILIAEGSDNEGEQRYPNLEPLREMLRATPNGPGTSRPQPSNKKPELKKKQAIASTHGRGVNRAGDRGSQVNLKEGNHEANRTAQPTVLQSTIVISSDDDTSDDSISLSSLDGSQNSAQQPPQESTNIEPTQGPSRDIVPSSPRESSIPHPEDPALHNLPSFMLDDPKRYILAAKDTLAKEYDESDEDWKKQFAGIAECLEFLEEQLTDRYCDADWGHELQEALEKLRAHSLYQEYSSGKQRLNLAFPNVWPQETRRLPPLGGSRLRLSRVPDSSPDQNDVNDLDEPQQRPSILFSPNWIKDPPPGHERDAFPYTKGLIWLKDEERKWALWTKEHAIKESWGLKKWSRRKEAIMPLPPMANWMGPVSLNGMDKDMKKTYDTLKEYERLDRELRRMNRRHSFRPGQSVLPALVKAIDQGLKDETGGDWDFSFREDEFLKTEEGGLVKIRPKEVLFLDCLIHPIPNHPTDPNVQLDRKGLIFLDMVNKCSKDPRPDIPLTSVGNYLDPSTVNLYKVSNKKDGFFAPPMKRCSFDYHEAWEYGKKLEKMGILSILNTHKVMNLARLKQFPEKLIRWPEISEAETNGENCAEAPEEAIEEDVQSEAQTASTKITIPNSEEDFGDYEKALPWFCSDESVFRNRPAEDKKRTFNFYRCLGYRFGQTMHDLKKEHEKNMEALKCPKRREANRKFIREALAYWKDDYLKRTENPEKNPAGEGKRVIPLYKDIVKQADPAQWDEKWKPDSAYNGEWKAAELVRKGILMEAYENKNPLWPPGNYIDEDGNDTGRPRRAEIWGWAHPSIKPKAKQFFDINRWPKELQTPERIKEIEASGPTKPHPNDSAQVEDREISVIEEPEVRRTYRDIYNSRTRYHEGQYLLGDTPRQRKFVINHIRKQFEAPVPPTLGERIARFFGKKRKRDDPEEENLRLPKPKYLPKIVPDGRPQEYDGRLPVSERRDVHVNKARRLGPPRREMRLASDVEMIDADAEMIAAQLQQTINENLIEIESSDEDELGYFVPPQRTYRRRQFATNMTTGNTATSRIEQSAVARKLGALRPWKRQGKGFVGEPVLLEIEDVEPTDYDQLLSPGIIELNQTFEKIYG